MSGTRRERPLNATGASLLGLLHDGPMSGWDLVALAQHRIGDFWTLTQSQVYRELATMDAAGLVEKGDVGPRERTPYRITDRGRAAFREWIDRDPGPDAVRVPLLLTLAFSDHLGADRLREIIAAGRARHAARLGEYLVAVEEVSARQDRVTLDFGIGYERAVLEWFDRLPELLDLS